MPTASETCGSASAVKLAHMPTIPLRRKLLNELNDADRSFKKARLAQYLNEALITSPYLNSKDGDECASSTSSSISTISSISSHDLDSSSHAPSSTPSLSYSDNQELFYATLQANLDKLRHQIVTSRVLQQNPPIIKCSQLDLLDHWREGNIDQYKTKVRVDPSTFDHILEKICDHSIFHKGSNIPQMPVKHQLAIFLYRAGHYGNAATPQEIGHWAGVSPGTVVNCTNRVMVALTALHKEAIHLPTAEEKQSAKQWVSQQVCPEWSDRYLVVDGTKFPLFQRPGLYGDAWLDRKCNYSLDCQVSLSYMATSNHN